jgi:hypothetical protein
MPKEQTAERPSTLRCSLDELAAVRMVRALRAERGAEQRTVQLVARTAAIASSRYAPQCPRPTSTDWRPECFPPSRRGSKNKSRRPENFHAPTRSRNARLIYFGPKLDHQRKNSHLLRHQP